LNEDGLKEELAVADAGAPAHFIAIQPFPALLDLPLGSDAVMASCGSRHTAVVTREWGWRRVEQHLAGDCSLPCLPIFNFRKSLHLYRIILKLLD
jgi:hypothetical protein